VSKITIGHLKCIKNCLFPKLASLLVALCVQNPSYLKDIFISLYLRQEVCNNAPINVIPTPPLDRVGRYRGFDSLVPNSHQRSLSCPHLIRGVYIGEFDSPITSAVKIPADVDVKSLLGVWGPQGVGFTLIVATVQWWAILSCFMAANKFNPNTELSHI